MPKFGGPNKIKQACRNRRCTKEMISNAKKKGYESRTSDEGEVTLSETEDDREIYNLCPVPKERGREESRRGVYNH